VKSFSRGLVGEIVAREPGKYTSSPLKARRKGRVFLDYLRNARGATAVAAWSARARKGAPVSMPLSWNELDAKLRSDAWSVVSAAERLRGKDPWAGFHACRQSLTAGMRRVVAS
jgi:bifunctional non-homologous end joining protein LigD